MTKLTKDLIDKLKSLPREAWKHTRHVVPATSWVGTPLSVSSGLTTHYSSGSETDRYIAFVDGLQIELERDRHGGAWHRSEGIEKFYTIKVKDGEETVLYNNSFGGKLKTLFRAIEKTAGDTR